MSVVSNALYVEFGQAVDLATNAKVRALDSAVRRSGAPWLLESIPSYSTLAVLFDNSIATAGEVEAAVGRLAASAGPEGTGEAGREFELGVRYGGADGPDLRAVAESAKLTEEEVVSIHTAREYTCYMLGFTPGFVYLGDVDGRIACPRRATPRISVPGGSVGIAGRQTGFYGVTSPGGWQIIGKLTEATFDVTRDPPSMIGPGDRVRFRRAV